MKFTLVLLAAFFATVTCDLFSGFTTPPPCREFEIHYPCKPCSLPCNIFKAKLCSLTCTTGCDCLPGFIRNESTSKCVPWLAYCLDKLF
ncbi:hypothetical protein L596_013723 [Steinernema carpocapsae]|uniref:TIL domain-containing protein n=1 Tax=Steinernema carpocapsae TaxID=34508 RepID=A0A4U5P230_STECR|nr:hypothetical protein L596_013723 [Steinernema carpocapsae]